MQEPAVIETEARVREVAKVLMRQLQTVKFMDKKVDAVGTALVSSNELLTSLKLSDDERTKLIEAVSRTQNSLYQNVSLLTDDWSHVNQLSETNDATLSVVETSLSSINESSEKSVAEFNELVASNKKYSQDIINTMSEKLDIINASMQDISQAEMLSVIMSLTKSLTEMVDDERKHRQEQDEATNQKLKMLTDYVVTLNQTVSHYESALKRIDARVKAITLIVDNVDERVSELSPAEYNMSEKSIIDMFIKNGQSNDDSDKSDNSDVDNAEAVEQVADESSNEVSEPVNDENHEAVAKKSRWKFWK